MFYCIFDQIYAASNKDHKRVVCCRVCFITYNSNVCYTILNIDTFFIILSRIFSLQNTIFLD